MRRQTVRPVRPVATALKRMRALPSSEVGPVDFWAFSRLAASWAAEAEDSKKAPGLVNDRSGMLDIQVMLRYEKQFRNLELQEARLARRRDKETAELRRLQQERKANEAAALERAAAAHLLAKHRNQPFDNPGIGFEFSTQRFETYLAALTPQRREQLLQKALADSPEQPATGQAAA